MSEDTREPEIPQEEDAATRRERRTARNQELRAEYEEFFEARFRTVAEELRAEGATEEEIQRKKHFYRRISEPLQPRVWRADGTPYSEEDYIRSGLAVPLDVDEHQPVQADPPEDDDRDL